MQKSRILVDNIAFRAVFTASQTETGFFPTNLGNYLKDFTWKALSASTKTIYGACTSLETANLLHFPFTNLSPSTSITVNFYSTDSFTGLLASYTSTPFISRLYQSTLWNYAPNTGDGFAFGRFSSGTIIFPEISFRSFSISINDSVNSSGFLEISTIVLGKSLDFAHRPNIGISLEWMTEGSLSMKPSGATQGKVEPVRKTLTFDMGGLSENERKLWTETFRINSGIFPIYFSSFPEIVDKEKEQDFEIYGFLDKTSQIKLVSCPRASTSLRIVSC